MPGGAPSRRSLLFNVPLRNVMPFGLRLRVVDNETTRGGQRAFHALQARNVAVHGQIFAVLVMALVADGIARYRAIARAASKITRASPGRDDVAGCH